MSPKVWLAVRVVLSIAFTLHLLGVFVAPMGASIRAAYDLARERLQIPQGEAIPMPWLNRLYQPYLDVLYLNHGYGFFAPDPGPSHLIDYTITLKDGSEIHGRFPDIKEHWPRLRYHRHFMLAEQIQLVDPQFEGAVSGKETYARHLLHEYDAKRVRLEGVEHALATPEDIIAGKKLDDPASYRKLGAVVVEADREGYVEEPAQ